MSIMKSNHLIIFFISLLCISLELFLTRILNLKTWNHVVYIIIPFAMLGYGIGANIFLVFRESFQKIRQETVFAVCLFLLSFFAVICTLVVVQMPIQLAYVATILTNYHSILMLAVSYTVIMIPFVAIGFLVVYLFSIAPQENHKLYFFDLLGAGTGAFLFFPLIYTFEVVHSVILLSIITFWLMTTVIFPRQKLLTMIFIILAAPLILFGVQEPRNYIVDATKGWEWIPGYFKPHVYETRLSQWHPLGLTEIYRIVDPSTREKLYKDNPGTFEINLSPFPEYSYVSTNFLAGTPIYNLSREGLERYNSKVKLFSQAMEVPYLAVKDQPKVVVIGTGGGRDIFMAKTHGAGEVIGAEINPAIYKAMSPNGKFYEYSGRVYTKDNALIFNVDGRHLVKKLKPNTYDLVILNGVDTFSALSTGAYAYAESYLYTKNAVLDYLKIINDKGIVNFNRWIFPRESLRLFSINLAALEEMGSPKPWEHIVVGQYGNWAIFLIKKTPWSAEEKARLNQYFQEHASQVIFPTKNWQTEPVQSLNLLEQYARAFMGGHEKIFIHYCPYDISAITDDNPFFYKYYKLKYFNPFKLEIAHHTGTIIFLTQAIVLIQALIFILLFILVPLYLFRRRGIEGIPGRARWPFIVYFSCLGTGFMFVEIPLMQRFTLLLGSPIYAITVTLTVLLISSGLGSLCIPQVQKIIKTREPFPTMISLLVLIYIGTFVVAGTNIFDIFMGLSFLLRILIVSLCLMPIGFLLGIFFPAGLSLFNKNYNEAIAWAWGINSGFSVLGSILSIILAQFLGFNAVLLLAATFYFIASLAYKKMLASLHLAVSK